MTRRAEASATGRRERQKQDKLNRIHAAALALFTEQGYEATTVRQIAAAADVATGTVFRYATDKADLLLMVFHDVIQQTMERALAPQRLEGSLMQVLPQLFDPFFEFYEQRQVLARDFLQQVLFHQSPWRTREMEQGEVFVRRLADFLQERQQAGEIRADLQPSTAALAIFALYQACLVSWLTSETPLTRVQGQLGALMELQVRAMQAETSLLQGSA